MKRYAIRLLTVILAVSLFVSMFAMGASAIELKTGIGLVESNGLRLRAKPNTDAEILATAAFGDQVVIIRKVDDWYLVDYNLLIGYVHSDYVSVKERENIELGNGIVEDSAVNMREKPDPSSKKLATLNRGDTAYIIGFNCGWYKVQYNGLTGYIRSDLMALTEAPKTNSQAKVGKAPVVVTVGDQAVNLAYDYLGVPYVWGGTSPKGFDCSGYTQYIYKQLGITLNRTAAQQLKNGYSVTNLQTGDLVFFTNTYSTSAAASHVGIYIGNNQFIHAANGGVKITSLDHEYYAPRYIGARRVVD